MERAAVVATASAAVSAVVLSWAAPGAVAAAVAPDADFAAVLGGFASVFALSVQLWLSIGAALTALAVGPSRAAGLARCIARVVVPGWWHRAVRGVLGGAVVSLPLLSPAAIHAATLQAWPETATVPSLGARDLPGDGSSLDGLPYPDRPFGALGPRTKVVVRPGDTLWAIAAANLGRRPADSAVATAWPAWYRVNKAVIGPDPNFIVAGTALASPPLHTFDAGGSR